LDGHQRKSRTPQSIIGKPFEVVCRVEMGATVIFIFIAFAAKGTLAHQMIDGAKAVVIFGEQISM
jgi:hypothetical protein